MVSIPTALVDLVGDVPDAEVVPWDAADEPPRREEIELVVVPPNRSPWLSRLDELPALRAVVLNSAGYDHAVPLLPDGVELANAVGVHDTATAELALALVLAAQRDIPEFVRDQDRRTWGAGRVRRSVADSTVLILGYGGIGRALAARLRAGEAQVLAVASTARDGGDLVDRVHGVDELPDLLPRAQVLVVGVPLTTETRGLVDAEVLARLPDDALVVNVARGPVVDTGALLAECANGRLRAALDVTDPEPLPPEHPLWTTPGVLISPHTGGASTAFPTRAAAYIRRQVEHFRDHGRLANVVAVGGREEDQ